MSREALNKLIHDSLSDRELNTRMQKACKEIDKVKRTLATEVLAQYDLTADEREAVLSKDVAQLIRLGVSNDLLRRADWCTGD